MLIEALLLRASAGHRAVERLPSGRRQLCLALLLSAGLLATDQAAAQGVRSMAPSVGALIALTALALWQMAPTDLPGVGGLIAVVLAFALVALPLRRRNADVRAWASRRSAASCRAAPGRPMPAGLDVPLLLAASSEHFLRLQSAWDRSDLEALQQMTTPQMFHALMDQLPQEGEPANRTDVTELKADLFAFEEVAGALLASVEFSGLVRESPGAEPAPFKELWLLVQNQSGDDRWLLAGQQALF